MSKPVSGLRNPSRGYIITKPLSGRLTTHPPKALRITIHKRHTRRDTTTIDSHAQRVQIVIHLGAPRPQALHQARSVGAQHHPLAIRYRHTRELPGKRGPVQTEQRLSISTLSALQLLPRNRSRDQRLHRRDQRPILIGRDHGDRVGADRRPRRPAATGWQATPRAPATPPVPASPPRRKPARRLRGESTHPRLPHHWYRRLRDANRSSPIVYPSRQAPPRTPATAHRPTAQAEIP